MEQNLGNTFVNDAVEARNNRRFGTAVRIQ